uniref:Reverse transcriptase domain-containing protein n=1 Tax=Graphocephala atropunctata TaxID=36148 RepID=A0A1B6KSQ8_9HEMI
MGSNNDIDPDTVEFFRSNKKNGRVDDFTFVAVSEDEVKSTMNEVKSRAVGIDDISIQMINAVSPYALGAITYLVNKCLETGVFPKEWKKSIVRPLPKVTAPKTKQELRPISILPAMSKIVEKIAIRQIMTHMKNQDLLPKLQSGFRRNHSTCTALTNMFSDLYEAKNKGKCSSLVMIDYSQAFDSIDHEMLMGKMSYYGFGEGVISWIRSYLQERQQVTKFGNETSKPLSKMRGVPQRRCLGPILFSLYTSDFPLCVQSCTVHLYADDCQLHLAYEPDMIEMAIGQINADLHRVSTWSFQNGLKLNTSKCSVLHIAPHNLLQALIESGVAVVLDGEDLAVCDKVKTLGVVLDRGLTFSDHVSHVTSVRSVICAIILVAIGFW